MDSVMVLAYSIVKAHNGHISIESDAEKGTTVHVYIPSMKKECRTEKEKECNLPHKSTLKVLVMDDEEMIRDVASEMLTSMGHSCDCVYGGQEALVKYINAQASGEP